MSEGRRCGRGLICKVFTTTLELLMYITAAGIKHQRGARIKEQEISHWDTSQRNTLCSSLHLSLSSPPKHLFPKQSATTSDTHMRPSLCSWPQGSFWCFRGQTVTSTNGDRILFWAHLSPPKKQQNAKRTQNTVKCTCQYANTQQIKTSSISGKNTVGQNCVRTILKGYLQKHKQLWQSVIG